MTTLANGASTSSNITGQSWYAFDQTGTYNSSADPSALRLASSGLFSGAVNAVRSSLNIGFSYGNGTAVASQDDWRVRVSCSPFVFNQLFSGPMTLPLRPGMGVTFPYTPTVTVNHTARYGAQQLTHSNYAAYFYEGSEVAAINIQGEFTVQNAAEGQYLLAAIYFFRAATKMFFGQGEYAGNPPPMVFLDGYGSHYFPHVPCVVTSVNHVMPPDVDYVEFPVDTSLLQSANQFWNSGANGEKLVNITRLPTTSQIQLTLQPVYSRANIHNNFSLQEFARGNLLGGAHGNANIPGGFI